MLSDPDVPESSRQALKGVLATYAGVRCGIFMDTVMIDCHGRIMPCCLLKAPDFPQLGNLIHEELHIVWARPGYEAFRFALQHGMVLPACADCPDVASA